MGTAHVARTEAVVELKVYPSLTQKTANMPVSAPAQGPCHVEHNGSGHEGFRLTGVRVHDIPTKQSC